MERLGTESAHRARGASRGAGVVAGFAALMVVALAGLAPVVAGCSGARAEEWVAPDRAAELVAGGATLLDVRTPGEFASGHPAAAVNVPVDEVASRLSEIDRSHPVVVYCAAGVRSARAAEVLRAQGYEVHDLGTVDRWSGP